MSPRSSQPWSLVSSHAAMRALEVKQPPGPPSVLIPVVSPKPASLLQTCAALSFFRQITSRRRVGVFIPWNYTLQQSSATIREPQTQSMILRTNTCNTARFKPPFACDNRHKKICQFMWLYLTYLLFDSHSLRVKSAEETRFQVQTILEVNQNLHDFKCFLDKSHNK